MTKEKARSAIPEIKNVLRPFFNRAAQGFARSRKPLRRANAFQHIRDIVQANDIPALYEIIEGKRHYEFPGLGNSFPNEWRTFPDSALLSLRPLASVKELRLQIGRINHYADDMLRALGKVDQINSLLLSQDWEPALTAIEEYRRDFGLSIVTLKKDLFASFQAGGLVGLSRRYDALTEGADGTAWKVFCTFAHDIVDPAYHPSRATKIWLSGLYSENRKGDWYSAPLTWHIMGVPGDEQFTALQSLRFNAVGLVDQLFFLWSLSRILDPNSNLGRLIGLVDKRLLSLLHERFARCSLVVPERYRNADGTITDTAIYRTSFFFAEVINVALWRSQLARLVFADGLLERTSEAHPRPVLDAVSNVFSDDGATAADYSMRNWTTEALGLTYSQDSSFLHATVVAEALQGLDSLDLGSSANIEREITVAKDLQDFVDPEYVKRLATLSEEVEAPLLTFLLRDLAFKRQRSLDNDLERRAAFMDIFAGLDHNAVLTYVSQLDHLQPSVADYIFATCSRVFLEKLYLLMSSVKDVLETRVALCEWNIQNRDAAKSVVEELKALREELNNLDARSDLDSTRVHVDEEGLRDWFNETQYGRVARYTQTVLAEDAGAKSDSFLYVYNKLIDDKNEMDISEGMYLKTQIGSQFVLLQIVEDTLKAFVSDKSFGMDAYLSRRIRHGTLSGFLVTPVSRVIQRIAEDKTDDHAEAYDGALTLIERWRSYVLSKIDHMRRRLIQIRSEEHPEALIAPTWRVASGVTYLDAMTSNVREEVKGSGGAYDIFSDVHALCWDLVERDLAKVRLYLLRDFSREIFEELGRMIEDAPFDVRTTAMPYVRDAQQQVNKKIQEACGWFIRPVRRNDSYDLDTLIGSMTSIVRELDASYSFKEEILVEKGVTINRGAFEVLGDVLFVLIGNAAKHGKRGGQIQIVAAPYGSDASYVRVEVTSEVEDEACLLIAHDRIRHAITVGGRSELESAAVQEGFSGIRKIIGLLERIRADGRRWAFFIDQATLKLTFEVTVPTNILFRQERA